MLGIDLLILIFKIGEHSQFLLFAFVDFSLTPLFGFVFFNKKFPFFSMSVD